eukprot:11322532-Ditylum_brightwellii.AAC.1
MQENFQASHHFSPKDYDKSSALEQWKSQQPVGIQAVFQMESETDFSKEFVKDALARTSVLFPAFEEKNIIEFTGLGDGCVLSAAWSGGSLIVLWDGRKH